MKIQTNLCGLEIEVKAKGLENRNRFNKEDTYTFLNYLSIFAYEAKERYKERGANALAKQADEFAQLLYDVCDKEGFYDSTAVYNMPDPDED